MSTPPATSAGKSLDEIAVAHLCDKAMLLPGRNGHGYAQHYDRFFKDWRDVRLRMMEIGVDHGASLRMWSDYFPKAEIVGVDNNPDCLEAEVGRANVVLGDQSSADFWKSFITNYGSDWHIIVDDGGHYADQIITSFNHLWPHVVAGGFYCVEDLGSAYPNYTQGRIQCTEVYQQNCVPEGWANHKDFFRDKIDEINLSDRIEFAFFSKELVIVRKS